MKTSSVWPAAALAVCVTALISCGAAGPPESVQAGADAAQPAPNFTLKDADGNDVSLSDYEGKVVLLNFWATWCGPCKIEMPWFAEFQRKYTDRGFTVLAVSLDEEGWDVVRPFAEQYQMNFPVVLGDDEMADRFGGIMALPTTLMIDKKGRIVNRHTGLVGKNDYEAEIESLL